MINFNGLGGDNTCNIKKATVVMVVVSNTVLVTSWHNKGSDRHDHLQNA